METITGKTLLAPPRPGTPAYQAVLATHSPKALQALASLESGGTLSPRNGYGQYWLRRGKAVQQLIEGRLRIVLMIQPDLPVVLPEPIQTSEAPQPAEPTEPAPLPELAQPAAYCVVVPRGRSLLYTARDPGRPGVITHYNGKPVMVVPERLPEYKWLAPLARDSEKTTAKLADAVTALQGLIDGQAPAVDYDAAYYSHCGRVWAARKADKLA